MANYSAESLFPLPSNAPVLLVDKKSHISSRHYGSDFPAGGTGSPHRWDSLIICDEHISCSPIHRDVCKLFFPVETHLECTLGLCRSIFLSSDMSSCCCPAGGRTERYTRTAAECAGAGTLGAGLQTAAPASWWDRFQAFAC